MVGATSGSPEVVAEGVTNSEVTSGGGFSWFFTSDEYDLSWQSAAVDGYLKKMKDAKVKPYPKFNTKGRAYPDISATGTNIVVAVAQAGGLYGGTSASSPITAAITQRAANDLGTKLGWINPLLYRNIDKFYDVVEGQNSGNEAAAVCPGPEPNTIWGFPAAPGWDPSTGVGTLGLSSASGYETYKSILSGN